MPLVRGIVGAVVLMLTASVLVGGCGTGKGSAKRAQFGHAPTVATTVTIDPTVGEVFAPAPADALPAMTAQQAWAAYTKVDTSYATSAIPSYATFDIGLLTLPLGPTGPNGSEAYTAHNELVYGFSWHSCPVSRNPKVPTLPPNPCIEWNFLDANTGMQIDETWQQ
jgi:hypothetical protein